VCKFAHVSTLPTSSFTKSYLTLSPRHTTTDRPTILSPVCVDCWLSVATHDKVKCSIFDQCLRHSFNSDFHPIQGIRASEKTRKGERVGGSGGAYPTG
jgi:hypothetical protein